MWDLIVLGIGGVGSSAIYQAARRGLKVLGIEAFEPAHDRGSSHGESRVIRMAYFEHPDYVPLLRRSYQLWTNLERACGRTLFHRCGLLEVGPCDGIVVPGVIRSAEQHGLPIERLTIAQAEQRFSMFSIPSDMEIVFETNAGYLLVEECVRTQIELSLQLGAHCLFGQRVLDWRSDGETVSITTDSEEYRAKRLIISAGSWSPDVLKLARSARWFRVVRKHLHWFGAESHPWSGAPCFFFEEPDRSFFYGFPKISEDGVKVAEHSGGESVLDPSIADRTRDQHDADRVNDFRQRVLRYTSSTTTRYATCLYTMSPDENFIVDAHPEFQNVVFVAGLSGHGFKFTPVLAEISLNLVCDGGTSYPIEFLRHNRLVTLLPNESS